jgi:hypothetical protein
VEQTRTIGVDRTTRAFHSASSTLRVNMEVYNMSGTRCQRRTAAVGSVKRPSPERAGNDGVAPKPVVRPTSIERV